MPLALDFDTVYKTGMILFILLYAIVFHEVGHAIVAYWMGDPTAKAAGRISLNPIVHLDPFGSVLVPILTYFVMGTPFGWAKPVPVNPFNFRRPVKGDILVSLAGVTANFLFALLLGLLLHIAKPGSLNQEVLMTGIVVNCLLFVFNLLPIPPLDGSHVFQYLLPRHLRVRYMSLAPFGFFILVILLVGLGRAFGGAVTILPIAYLNKVVLFLTGHGW